MDEKKYVLLNSQHLKKIVNKCLNECNSNYYVAELGATWVRSYLSIHPEDIWKPEVFWGFHGA